MPYWTCLCVLRRTYRQSSLYETLFHCITLSKHHHNGNSGRLGSHITTDLSYEALAIYIYVYVYIHIYTYV